MKLNGKVTIITGASGGIGKSVAQKVLEEGSKVVLVSRNKNKLKISIVINSVSYSYYSINFLFLSLSGY